MADHRLSPGCEVGDAFGWCYGRGAHLSKGVDQSVRTPINHGQLPTVVASSFADRADRQVRGNPLPQIVVNEGGHIGAKYTRDGVPRSC